VAWQVELPYNDMVGISVGCQCLGFIDIYCLSLVQMSLDSESKTSTWARGAGAMRWYLLLCCGGHCFGMRNASLGAAACAP
jgi:hypothetical protein